MVYKKKILFAFLSLLGLQKREDATCGAVMKIMIIMSSYASTSGHDIPSRGNTFP